MSKTVNTVLGPVSPEALGDAYMHEHVLFAFPGFSGDFTVAPLKWDEAVQICVEQIKPLMEKYNLKTIVDATPNDCGRNVLFCKAVSEATGINIIPVTGYYSESTGASSYFKFRSFAVDISQEAYGIMKKEVTEGIEGTGIKAGLIKCASSAGTITNYEKAFFTAAAKVSAEEGIPIITHTTNGTMGPEQAELLIASGADPKRISIGHSGDSTDIKYHLKILAQGVYISIDRLGLQVMENCPLDSERETMIAALCAAGYADRIMLGHDFIIKWLGRDNPIPEAFQPFLTRYYLGHIHQDIVPELKKMGVTEEQIHLMLVENPRRFFSY
jgi:phosphotriesterase-related protein